MILGKCVHPQTKLFMVGFVTSAYSSCLRQWKNWQGSADWEDWGVGVQLVSYLPDSLQERPRRKEAHFWWTTLAPEETRKRMWDTGWQLKLIFELQTSNGSFGTLFSVFPCIVLMIKKKKEFLMWLFFKLLIILNAFWFWTTGFEISLLQGFYFYFLQNAITFTLFS